MNRRGSTAVRLVALVLIAYTVIMSRHAPGGSGRGLVVSVAFAFVVVAWIAWMVRAYRFPESVVDSAGLDGWRGADIYTIAVAGGLLTAASPSSAASAFAFVGVVAAGLRAELRRAVPVAAAAAFALAVGQLLYDGSALGTLAYVLGFCAALLAAANSRQSVVRADQAELLLAQSQRSHEEQLRAARLEESTRIARDIHDVLAHALAGLTIQLEATAALVEQGADRDTVLARLHRAHDLAREGLRETRRAVGALRGADEPVAMAAPEAIETLVAAYRTASESPLTLTIDGDRGRLGGAVGEAVLRIAQEALTNARKHAPGAAIEVTLHAGAGSGQPVVLVVEDRHLDGATVPAPGAGSLAASGGGFGVQGMRERAEALGGTLAVGAAEGGWRVELRLPPSTREDVAVGAAERI